MQRQHVERHRTQISNGLQRPTEEMAPQSQYRLSSASLVSTWLLIRLQWTGVHRNSERLEQTTSRLALRQGARNTAPRELAREVDASRVSGIRDGARQRGAVAHRLGEHAIRNSPAWQRSNTGLLDGLGQPSSHEMP